jgi:ABC-type Zn uptake system ZnuABC Zn-binding protein ZnuA
VPASYLAACTRLHAVLLQAAPDQQPSLDQALQRTRQRVAGLEGELRERVKAAGLVGARGVVSGHQAEFCRWLGRQPVARYSGAEATTPAELETLIKQGRQAGVLFVIANVQEGRQVGEVLAWQLGAKLVVFSNFPAMNAGEACFDELVRRNLHHLLQAAGTEP